MGREDKERMRQWTINSTKLQKHPGDTSSTHGSLLKPLPCFSSSSRGSVAKLRLCFSFQEGTWLGAEGAGKNGYGRGREKRNICVVLGIVEGVTMRFMYSHCCGEGC